MFGFFLTIRTPHRGRELLRDCMRAAMETGLPCKEFSGYEKCDTLVLYGVGGADRYHVAKAHRAAGGRVIMWDAGYWDRQLSQVARKYRVAIDDYHPHRRVMSGDRPKPRRFMRAGIEVGSDYDPDGPIMLVGNSPKSVNIGARGWTGSKAREIRRAFPEKKILYRPKPRRPKEPRIDFDELSTGDIAAEVRRCSLVVCRHSNVAVDATIAGVPVVCDDGAARAIYPRRLEQFEKQPSLDTRIEFLERLAYWQWSRDEMTSFWSWFLDTQSAIPSRDN